MSPIDQAPAPGSAASAVALRVWRGDPYPLGATWDGAGVNFAVFSEHADAVDLCLFDDEAQEHRVRLIERPT